MTDVRPKYELKLFGGFALHDPRGMAVAVRSKKSRCLLAYLALSKGKEVNRDVLAGLLWSDRDDTRARHSLSQEVYRLRGQFSDEAQAAFRLATDTVGLATEEVDVLRFEHGIASESAEIKAEAGALYEGDLLAGLETGQESFDDWLRTERERLRDRAVAALHSTVEALSDGPPEHAVESASRLLSIDPTNEEAHRALMEVYVRSGRRDMALKQYEKCKDILRTELDIEPDARTKELYETVNSAPQTQSTVAAEQATPYGASTGDRTMTIQPMPSKSSIAVLPFDNMSGVPEQEYFSDGIADDIITALSSFRDLFVIARNSSFTYKGRAVDIKQIGRELGVRYILEGGVRKASNRVRITAQLIETETGKHLWAKKYDGELADIFDLQDEITTSVVGAIQPTVFLAEAERARHQRPENLDAYDMCMRGWAHGIHFDQQSLIEAQKCFLHAIELDNELAQAYTGLAHAHFWEWVLGLSKDPELAIAEASRAARKAIEIDGADADAHTFVSWVSLFSKRLDVATAEIEHAIELSPSSAQARGLCAVVYCFDGRPDEGVQQAKLALQLSPRHWSRFVFFHLLALCQYSARDYAAAAQAATEVVALKPDYLYGHWHLAGSCAQLGQTERAQEALRELLRIHPNLDMAFVEAVAPYRHPADLEHLIEGLRKAGWNG